MKINPTYKTYSQGTYNKMVDVCPFCGNKMNGSIFENCKGISEDAYGEHVMIIECNECFEKFYFHCNKKLYDCFIHTIENGKNIFFNKHENEIL
jgi:hypothetical protein